MYTRRKRDAQCFNPNDKENVVFVKNCNCTEQDWECDFGYQETITNGQRLCRLVRAPPRDPPQTCPANTVYYVSKGYRKVTGDTCVGGIDHSPLAKSCPAAANGPQAASSYGWLVALMIILLFAAIGVVAFVVYKNEAWRNKVSTFLGIGAPSYSRLGARPNSLADEEFGIGTDPDLDDPDVEEDARVIQDHEIMKETTGQQGPVSSPHEEQRSDFDPRT